MPRWFGRRSREEKQAAARDALLGAAQQRGIPTMRVDDPEELAVSLGVAAYQNGDLARAEETFRTVAAAGRRASAKAAYYLGELLQGRGEVAEAEGLLRAVESQSPQWAPRAAFNLGGVLAMQGRNDEAEAAFRRAVDSGHPEDAPGALTYLAALYFRTGR
ncbi:MAG TPA: tetratricopeptide repeat protein, partial [Actinomycetes bacterium]|nr:tetratricopeptide repeat protein [Actinomycetes bacterium]